MSADFRDQAAAYYTGKLQAHGASPRGVDWNGEASQQLRFEQLLRVLPPGGPPPGAALLDYGCGYGALLPFLRGRVAAPVRYVGYDAAPAMIEAARALYGADAGASFTTDLGAAGPVDYAVASGVFNVRQDAGDAAWLEYILASLRDLDAAAGAGWAANFLTKYSDAPFMRDYLYYADPLVLFDWCKRNLSKRVALLHDYELFEFTLIVRKEAPRT